MRRTKADRFERQMEKAFQRWVNGPQEEGWLTEFTKEFRREHLAVVRMVKAYKELCRPHDTDRCVEWQVAWHYIENTCDDILARLEARAR